jgi:hypothetical protein
MNRRRLAVAYHAVLNIDDLTTVYVERQAELLVCTDPADFEGTHVSSHYRYEAMHRGFAGVEAATAATKRAAEGHLACDEALSGRPRWEAGERNL